MIHIQLLTNIQRQHQAKNDHKEVNFSKTNTNKIQFTRQFTYQLMRGFSKNVTVQNKSISIFPPPIPWCLLNLPTYPPPVFAQFTYSHPLVFCWLKQLLNITFKYWNTCLYVFLSFWVIRGTFKTQCLTKRTQCYVRKISIMLCPNEKLLIRCLLVQRTWLWKSSQMQICCLEHLILTLSFLLLVKWSRTKV